MANLIDAQIEQALLAGRQGNVQEGLRICDAILGQAPENAKANLISGILLARSRNEAKAIPRLNAALQTEPNNVEALKWLTGALAQTGQFDEAIRVGERAVSLGPNDYASLLSLAKAYFGAGRVEECVAIYSRATELDPKREAAYSGLAQAHLSTGNPMAARAALQRAVMFVPSPVMFLRLAELSMQVGAFFDATQYARAVPSGTPEEIPALVTLAAAYRNMGQSEDESNTLDRLTELDPQNHYLYMLRGFRLQTRGRFEEAESEFRRSIALHPRQGGAYHSIVTGRRITAEDSALVELMEDLVSDSALPAPESGPLHFALGKAYDDLADYARAFHHFKEGNRLTREYLLGSRSFDRAALERDVDRTIDLFTRRYLRAHVEPHDYSPTPIVISGAIRSGTTLLEQILSSHPKVGAAGEQIFWRSAVQECWTYDPYEPEIGVHQDVIRRRAGEYVRMLAALAPGKTFVTDKEPGNHRLLGILRLALPGSPLIQMKRNLADIAMSIFTTHFQTGEEYAWDQDDIVFALRQHARLEDHWKSVLPPERFLEVDYQDLVTNPETTVRRVLEFCGLPWDDAVLRSEANDRTISTPSFWQVRQPVNPNSVGRWKRYEPWIGPFKVLA